MIRLPLLSVLACFCVCGSARAGFVNAIHVPARGPDAVTDTGGSVNTVAFSDPLLDWDTDNSAAQDTWNWRPNSSLGLAGQGWHETDTNHTNFPNNDAPMLVTTVDGLVPGGMYEMYLDYLTVPNTASDGTYVNWSVLAGLSPTELTAFGYVDGMTMGSYTTVGLGDSRVAFISDDGSAIDNYRAYLGTATANGSGEISVYIDDTDAVSVANATPGEFEFEGTNGRAAYDGVAYSLIPEPGTATLVAIGLIGLAATRRRFGGGTSRC